MKTTGHTVLITGGSSGIGLAIAERFLHAENNVIILGRQKKKLEEVKNKYPSIHTRVCDMAIENDRRALVDWVTKEFPAINVLVNNAGIQQSVNLLQAEQEWDYYRKEISINMDGPIHLSMLLIPHLLKQKEAVIINVSSGLAIRPGVWVPVYSATKAAIHSFTQSLRLQLAKSNVCVVEVFPPAVNTDLGGVGIHTHGAPLNEFANSVFKRFGNGDLEIGYGDSEKRLHASKEEIVQGTKEAWENFLINNPDFLKKESM